MATIYKTSFNTFEGAMTFFENLNYPLVTSSTRTGDNVDILVDNTVTINIGKFSSGGGNLLLTFAITYNGSSTGELTRVYVQRSGYYATLTLCSTNNLFYFQIQDNTGSSGAGQDFTFIYQLINSNFYYGYKTGSTAFHALETISLNAVDNNVYKYSSLIPYSAPAGQIYFRDSSLLLLSSIKAVETNEFISCSTVTLNSVITFNNKNYFSIGTNTLLPMDNN